MPPLQPPKLYIRINFGREGIEIVHLWFSKYTFSIMKRRAAPYDRPQKIIYFQGFFFKFLMGGLKIFRPHLSPTGTKSDGGEFAKKI